jgi:hypothetical protein
MEKCILCDDNILGYGNNPWPLREPDEGECCEFCNDVYVIPARLEQLAKAQAAKAKELSV